MERPSIDPELLIRMLLVGYATNYLIDLKHAIIVDVEASRAIRQAEVGAVRTMIDRVNERCGLYPEKLAADTAYESAEMVAGLSMKKGLSRTSRCSTNRGEMTTPLAARISCTTMATTFTAVSGAKNSGTAKGPADQQSMRMECYVTGPVKWTATHAN